MEKEQSNAESQQWAALYPALTRSVRSYVLHQDVSCWQGQEEDIVRDIVQYTIVRLYLYLEQVRRGEAQPIVSLERFGKAIASNYCKDLRRKEERLLHPQQNEESKELEAWLYDEANQPEAIIEQVSLSISLQIAVCIIAELSAKQQHAVLVDLAKYTDFGDEPGALERAFQDIGIAFRAYQHLAPVDPVLKNRHASSLSIAYKKIHELALARLREIDIAS